ncbi:hypothetical protein ACIBCA_02440 [Kitasatospora sp. NPDC051170]|uniref:hypothetical protein n=1 Tax=Kitasatospora sp. NPDC051170 TaxID=3364056 RepID=UPI0037B122D1
MALSQDEWAMLEAAAAGGSDRPTGELPLERRVAANANARRLVKAGLCEAAGPESLDALAADGSRPAWALRATTLGRDLLHYRALRDRPRTKPAPPVTDDEYDTVISVRSIDLPVLRAVCAGAEAGALPGVDAPALGAAIARARRADGSTRYRMNVTTAELTAVLRVMYMEMMRGGGAAGYNHLLRSTPLSDTYRPDPLERPEDAVARARIAAAAVRNR